MPKREKVMYLITKNTQGRGGHYYSLKTTVKALSNIVDSYVITISKVETSVVDDPNIERMVIYCNGWNFFKTMLTLIKITKKEQPDVIHAFDSAVLLFARILSFVFKLPLLYTKCGGKNPTGFYPYARDIIVYSYENLHFFTSENKLKNTNFYFIPNRVATIKSDNRRILLIKEKLDKTKKVFLRIARFGPAYKKSILQSIDLIKFLTDRQIDAQLVLIGIIQDKKVYDEITEYIDKHQKLNIYVFTNNEMTVNASELIDIADCVIGTGRSLMEAASKSKVLLTPVEDSTLPVLVTQKCFNSFFATNFSPRNQLGKELIQENKQNIIALFKSPDFFQKQQEFSKKIYEQYFDIDTKHEEYNKVYESISYDTRIHLVDFLEHLMRTIIGFIRTVK